MDLELDEVFEWQTPFCTLLGYIDAEDGVGSMLDQIELPEIIQDDVMPEDRVDALAISTNLVTEEPISCPLWPRELQASAVVQAPVRGSGLNPDAVKRFDSGRSQTASQGSHDQAVPVTPPAAKPKRTRATQATSKKSAPKAKKARQVVTVVQPPKESCQMPTQAEHIMRERLRRDDMTAKYTILESLLPPGPKRERAVVVDTAISFVKDLQQKRNELLKRRAHLKVMAPISQSPRQVQSKKLAPLHIDSSGVVTATCTKLQHSQGEYTATECATDSPMLKEQRELITSTTVTAIPTKSLSAIVEDPSSGSLQHLLQVHVHFCEEEIVIEMVCHSPRQNFHSFLLEAVESFGLAVTRCSINRVPHGFVQCSMSCTKSPVPNPSLTSSEIQTSATLIGALRNVLSVDRSH